MRRLAIVLLLAGCGSTSTRVAGSWTESSAAVPGAGLTMTLLSDGSALAGTGVGQLEAGASQAFTVAGKINTPAAGTMTFHFVDGSSEDFAYTLPDQDHLTLSGTSTIALIREE